MPRYNYQASHKSYVQYRYNMKTGVKMMSQSQQGCVYRLASRGWSREELSDNMHDLNLNLYKKETL